MTSPQRGTILQRAPELKMALDADNELSIRFDGQHFLCGAHGLAALDVFARPMTFAAGLEVLRSRAQSVQDWMELASTVNGLYQNGIRRNSRDAISFGPARCENQYRRQNTVISKLLFSL